MEEEIGFHLLRMWHLQTSHSIRPSQGISPEQVLCLQEENHPRPLFLKEIQSPQDMHKCRQNLQDPE